jgi:Uma2 family endonuclease
MNDNQIIYMGVNAPRIHQAIIGRLIYWLTDLYLKNKTELIAYPETMIDESTTSPVPDVMLVNHDTDLTEVIIEVTHTQGVPKDIEKLKSLMKIYRVNEGFVYDYKQKRWHKFRLGGSETGENSSFCDAVGGELAGFVL